MNSKAKTDEERLKALLEINELNKSGYAGILPNGNIVDRRKFPNAVPVQKNTMFGIPEPKNLEGLKIDSNILTWLKNQNWHL